MIQQYKQHIWLSSILFAVSVFLDRLTKSWALMRCTQEYVINRYLSCELAFNRGISWSLFDSQDSLIFLLVSGIIALVIVSFVFNTYHQYQQQKSLYGASLVLAGAISNFADRIIYGGVVDFISIGSWPLFNIADALICCGLALMIWQYQE